MQKRLFGVPHFDSGLIASIAAALVSTAGLLSMALLGDWGRRNSSYFSAFAIGVLLVAVTLHLAPEALEQSPKAWRAAAAGFVFMAVVGAALTITTRGKDAAAMTAFGFASIIALAFHSFLDGLIYQSSFHEHLFTGGVATAGLLLHEFPEGVIAFFLLRETGMSVSAASFWAFIAASVTTVAGALFASVFIGALSFASLAGATAGALIYIMVFHLGPHACLVPDRRGYAVASLGVVIGVAAIVLRHLNG